MFQDFIPTPKCALFGLTPESCSLQSKACVIIVFTTLIARHLILLSGKEQVSPNFFKWVRDTMYFLNLEKIRYTLKGSLQKIREIWTPFL